MTHPIGDGHSAGDVFGGVRVLVLGASGFIGRWVARSLSAQGADLHLCVRSRRSMASIVETYQLHGEIHQVDLSLPGSGRDLMTFLRPAVVFNLAGYGIDKSERDGVQARRINAELPGELVEGLADQPRNDWPGQTIVHVGSALEYGLAGGNLNERTVPRPTTVYGRTKLAGTRAFARACQNMKVSGLTARLFTVYGPGEHTGRLLPSLLQAAENGNRLELTAGHQERDFTFVSEVAEGLLRLSTVECERGMTVNLATGRLTTVRRFAEIAASVLAIPAGNLMFGALEGRAEEMHHDPVNLGRLRGLTGWTPELDPEQGIRRTKNFLAYAVGRRVDV